MRFGRRPRAVAARAKEFVQHVIFVGGENQAADRQAHLSGDVPRQDVAEIARGYGEVDRIAFAARDGEVAFEVIDDLCGDPRPVDRIDGADCVTRLEFGVGADRLDDVLAFVEHALDREIVDVRIGERVHLRRLERAHPALRRQHEHRDSALAAHRVLGGTPRIAGGGAKNVEPAPALHELTRRRPWRRCLRDQLLA